jgi:hypothetical protein
MKARIVWMLLAGAAVLAVIAGCTGTCPLV